MLDTQDILRAEFAGSSERAAAIVGAAYLDELLTNLLNVFMVPDTAKKDKEIFSGNGPLSTFSSKINMSWKLGLISDRERTIFHSVRSIRNDFAHKLTGISFADDAIKQKVSSIEIPYHLLTPVTYQVAPDINGGVQIGKINKANSSDAREVFQEVVIYLANALSGRDAVARIHRRRKAEDFTKAEEPVEKIMEAMHFLKIKHDEAVQELLSRGQTVEEDGDAESNEKAYELAKFIRLQIIEAHKK